jgi:hypothetical protein
MNTLNYILQRYSDNRQSTLGFLCKLITYADKLKLFLCGYTLEDEFRESKVSKETRIPAGKYEIVIQEVLTEKTKDYQKRYPWFEKHLMLKNVPNFQGIYIHIGNDDKDTDGCILMGDGVDNNTIGPGAISASTNCFSRFYKELYPHLKAGGKAFIEIRDENRLL